MYIQNQRNQQMSSTKKHLIKNTYIHIYIFIYAQVCLHVCAPFSVGRDRMSEREREQKEKKNESKKGNTIKKHETSVEPLTSTVKSGCEACNL